MKVVRTEAELRTEIGLHRSRGRSIGFVPTMGALHEGHLSLMSAARAATDVVVVSIFVNPLQFGPTEDLATYPRDEDADIALCRGAGVDVVFVPSVAEMYPAEASTRVTVGALGSVLEGEHRPGHFDGVATVVTKLFGMVAPDKAFFGQKDAQQVAVVKRVVEDLSMGIEVLVGATVRERDGLALSSRNRNLDAQARDDAVVLAESLRAGTDALRAGGTIEVAEKAMWHELTKRPGVEADYARVVDPATFSAASPDGPYLLVVAARVGGVRLIDNQPLEQGKG